MVTVIPMTYEEWTEASHVRPRNILRVDTDRAAGGFTTHYAPACSIEKTVAHGADRDYTTAGDPASPGRLEVHMRTGEVYTFAAWATRWCASYGISVSDDGARIYVISDIKGLGCYTPHGEVLWKTRYTSVTDVVAHPDGSVTALTYNGNVYRMDENGRIVARRKSFDGRPVRLLSNDMVAACTGDYTVTFFDTATLEPICKTPFRKLLERLDCTAISESCVLLVGTRYGKEIPLPNGGRQWERLPTVCLLDRRDNRVLRVFDHTFVRENCLTEDGGDRLAAYAALEEGKIILYPGARDGMSFRRIEISI